MKSIKFNFIMNMLLTVSSILFPLITFPYVSRILQADGMGKVSFATSVITYFAMVAQLGIPTYGIRACAQKKDNKDQLTKTVHEIFIINIIMTIMAYVLFVLTLLFIDKFKQNMVLLIISSFTILFNTLGMNWLYSALEQYSYITIRALVFKIVSLVLMFLLVHEREDYIIYAAITVFANVGSNIINFVHARKHIYKKKYKKYELMKHVKPILTFFSMSVASTVYTSLDTVMLGFIKDDSEVGFYNAAVKIRLVLLGVVNSLATVLLPRASYYIEHGMKNEFLTISKKAMNFIMIVALPMWIYFTLFAKESVLLLSGDSYLPAVRPMILIMPTVLICGLSNLIGIQMLVPLGKEKIVLHSQIIGAILDMIINLITIPHFGAAAAAAATMIAEFVILFIQFRAISRGGIKIFSGIKIGKIIISIIFAVGASLWVKKIEMNVFAVLIISAVLFFGIYLLVLLVQKEKMAIEIKDICVKFLKTKRHLK